MCEGGGHAPAAGVHAGRGLPGAPDGPADHLDRARAAHERGELLLAGALPDPFDRAVLVWSAPGEVVERFVEADPYVVHGLVTGWTIRPWNVVVGG